VDCKSDESYAPKNITIQAGDHPTMMFDYASVKLDNPEGWIEMDLRGSDGSLLDSFCLRLVITSNHQNGRDSRFRGVRLFGLSEPHQGIK
jgi:anaphase-promoting complex subunit 10